jgi:hypothetical protein
MKRLIATLFLAVPVAVAGRNLDACRTITTSTHVSTPLAPGHAERMARLPVGGE